jgi:hypothetical protein
VDRRFYLVPISPPSGHHDETVFHLDICPETIPTDSITFLLGRNLVSSGCIRVFVVVSAAGATLGRSDDGRLDLSTLQAREHGSGEILRGMRRSAFEKLRELRHVPATPGHACVASEHGFYLARPRCRATRFLIKVSRQSRQLVGRAQLIAMLAKIACQVALTETGL